MRVSKKDRQGTIHDLPIRLANMAEMDDFNPATLKDKNYYIKILDDYKVFKPSQSIKEKRLIVSKLKLINFDENKLSYNSKMLKAINSYNRIIEKTKVEIENQIRAGKNVKANELIHKNLERIEIDIPRNIRILLRIHEKSVFLKKYTTIEAKNNINYYSGLGYNFIIKDGFNKPYSISYDSLQNKRKKGNIVEFLLNKFKSGVEHIMEKDREMYESSDPRKWKLKILVYDKILNEVLEHNLSIATNKEYNEPFVKRDSSGKISKKDSKIPILMEITGSIIELYIP